jgi:uncharacterized protein
MIILSIIGLVALIAFIFVPRFLINWTLAKHGKERPDMPGTGGELARHLLDDAGLQDVLVEKTDERGDHYSLTDRAVRLSPSLYDGKSITAIAVAAHEVAHAVQHRDGYGPLMTRARLSKQLIMVDRIGQIVLVLSPLLFVLIRSPVAFVIEIGAALCILSVSIFVHLFTLPTEFDASFKKALPVLQNYIPAEDMPGAKAVLRAAAFTYVASALISLIDVARWLRILRF